MIAFCEDCGAKNHINQGQIETGRAVFKCTSCFYKNDYLLSSTHPSSTVTKEDYLRDILSFPDILGGFLYHLKEGVLDNKMPAAFKKESLNGLGHALSKNLLAGLSSIDECSRMTLYMSKRNIVIQFIDPELVIIAMCESKKSVKQVEVYLTDLLQPPSPAQV